MSKLDADAIDTLCVELKGHNNWSYGNQLDEGQLELLKKKRGITILVFHKESSQQCDECSNSAYITYDEVENQNLCDNCKQGHREDDQDCRECIECGVHAHDCTCEDGPYLDE